ncbi:MAG: DUF4276 family protein [Planctomycetes bacterium]|nr:DUF4276 family protein [Planctomycetota bacterium]
MSAPVLATVVEGHGEVEALPVLLRRRQEDLRLPTVEIRRPIRAPGQAALTAFGGIERWVILAMRQPRCAGILVLYDAEGRCPKTDAPEMVRRARAVCAHLPLRVVMAKNEYEAWFLAGLNSLRGHRDLRADACPPGNPEEIRNCKDHLTQLMPPGRIYKETSDQAALTARLDYEQARKTAPSLDKFLRDVDSLLREMTTSGTRPQTS